MEIFAILFPKISYWQNYQKFTVDFVLLIKKRKMRGIFCRKLSEQEKRPHRDG
jgi:hypothetical protein